MIKLKFITEKTIAKLSKKINIKIDVDRTTHAGERQYRSVESIISDDEIVNTVNKAIEHMANMLLFDELGIGDYIVIKDKDTILNVVGRIQQGFTDEIDFLVITVMKKQNFIPKQNTKVIEV